MTISNAPHEPVQTILMEIPGLADTPYLGSGCCVVAADQAIREELESWPGVTMADVDAAKGSVWVTLSGDTPTASDLLETIDSLGFPVATVSHSDRPRRGGE